MTNEQGELTQKTPTPLDLANKRKGEIEDEYSDLCKLLGDLEVRYQTEKHNLMAKAFDLNKDYKTILNMLNGEEDNDNTNKNGK